MKKQLTFQLITPKHKLLRLDVWPFLFVYIALFYYYFSLEEDDIYTKLAIIGFCFSHCLTYIFGHWSKKIRCLLQYNKIKGNLKDNLEKGSHVYVSYLKQGQNSIYSIEDFFKEQNADGQVLYFFHFQQRKFFFNKQTEKFQRMKPRYKQLPIKNILEHATDQTGHQIYQFYDPNILQIPIRPFWDIVRDQIMDPFSFFQLFSVFLWMLDQNRIFSLMILSMLLLSTFTIAIQRIKTLASFRSMSLAAHYIYVYRKQKWVKISSYQLKPMDIILMEAGYKYKKIEAQQRMTDAQFLANHIPFSNHLPVKFLQSQQSNVSSHKSVPCDALLLSGSCIVNESILTGQAIPQIKDSMEYINQDEPFNISKNKQCVLFCGTEILQTSQNEAQISPRIKLKNAPPVPGCIALVLRTGYDTSKGKLIRTVIANTENLNIKQSDGLFVILFLLICSIITSVYVLNVGLEDQERNKNKLFLRCILIITTVVPPELPMILTLAVNNSILYLQKKRIYVTQPYRIPLGGKVDVIAFDKTGTLTSDKFTFEGIVDDLQNYKQLKKVQSAKKQNGTILAGCHTLIHVQNKLIGDPIQLLFFQTSNWDYSSTNKQAYKKKSSSIQRIQIKHVFPFRSDLKRMSTKVKHTQQNGRNYKLLTKGAPQIIEGLLQQIPQNYKISYNYYTSKGFRVLALAYRNINQEEQQLNLHKQGQRQRLQKNLKFAGFLICNSPLKDDTLKNIQKLQSAKYKLVMITGDNLFTAANVGQKLNFGKNILKVQKINNQIIVQFDKERVVVNNLKEFRNLIQKDSLVCTTSTSGLPQSFLPYINIFARTSPSQKQYIVKKIKQLQNTYLLYAGDGTNDVGGLRGADVGIAVVGINGLGEIQKKQQDIKQKEKQFKRKKDQLTKDLSIPFGKKMEKMNKLMNQYNEHRRVDLTGLSSEIKFGDACIAAPFTSKHSNSIYCVIIVIRQAISTLVTTIQTYKILGISSLLQAYALAQMNMQSLKYSQKQTTVIGILGAINFYFFSNAKPMKKIADVRAPHTIFNFWFLLSLFGQIGIFLFGNYYALNHIGLKYMPEQDKLANADVEFKASFLNTVIFLFSLVSQSVVFLVNHGGQPHIESLLKNKKYFKFLIIPLGVCFLLASNIYPDLSAYVDLKFDKVPYEANIQMLKAFGLIVFSTYILERICKYGQFRKFYGWI